MTEHDLSAGSGVLGRVTQVARRALTQYQGDPGAAVELLTVSENATFLVTDPDAGRSVLRVHRLGYHPPGAIASELAWMEALRAEAGVRTPAVLAAADGRRVVTVPDEAGAARQVVRFEFVPGTEPGGGSADYAALAGSFAELGEITARMHAHARSWARPGWFTRFAWDLDAAFGPRARWGRWRDGAGVGPAEAGLLGRLAAELAARLAAYGTGAERFGLVHADTRLANLLVHEGETTVIDFDDAGFSWYLYDVATTVSFFEDDPAVPGLIDAWLNGYRKAGTLTAADEAEIWTLILYRRLLLLAWMGSHPAAAEAANLGPEYAAGSCELAEKYLSGKLKGI